MYSVHTTFHDSIWTVFASVPTAEGDSDLETAQIPPARARTGRHGDSDTTHRDEASGRAAELSTAVNFGSAPAPSRCPSDSESAAARAKLKFKFKCSLPSDSGTRRARAGGPGEPVALP